MVDAEQQASLLLRCLCLFRDGKVIVNGSLKLHGEQLISYMSSKVVCLPNESGRDPIKSGGGSAELSLKKLYSRRKQHMELQSIAKEEK